MLVQLGYMCHIWRTSGDNEIHSSSLCYIQSALVSSIQSTSIFFLYEYRVFSDWMKQRRGVNDVTMTTLFNLRIFNRPTCLLIGRGKGVSGSPCSVYKWRVSPAAPGTGQRRLYVAQATAWNFSIPSVHTGGSFKFARLWSRSIQRGLQTNSVIELNSEVAPK